MLKTGGCPLQGTLEDRKRTSRKTITCATQKIIKETIRSWWVLIWDQVSQVRARGQSTQKNTRARKGDWTMGIGCAFWKTDVSLKKEKNQTTRDLDLAERCIAISGLPHPFVFNCPLWGAFIIAMYVAPCSLEINQIGLYFLKKLRHSKGPWNSFLKTNGIQGFQELMRIVPVPCSKNSGNVHVKNQKGKFLWHGH